MARSGARRRIPDGLVRRSQTFEARLSRRGSRFSTAGGYNPSPIPFNAPPSPAAERSRAQSRAQREEQQRMKFGTRTGVLKLPPERAFRGAQQIGFDGVELDLAREYQQGPAVDG